MHTLYVNPSLASQLFQLSHNEGYVEREIIKKIHVTPQPVVTRSSRLCICVHVMFIKIKVNFVYIQHGFEDDVLNFRLLSIKVMFISGQEFQEK